MTYVGAAAMVHGKTQGAYPAARAMLSAIYEGALVDFDTALRIEARWFTRTLMNPSSAAMIRTLFLSKQALEKGALRPDLPDESVKKLGVLGAGMMGAGIATVAAQAGIEVVLIDRDQEAADRGKAHAAAYFDDGVKRKKTTPEARDATLARITATPDYAALAGADLVIEAVFEDPAVKAEATAKAEAHLDAQAIFATNTSTLPIAGLAKASRNPANFLGIHFFSPVEKMLLVEVIRGPETSDRAVAKALDFVRQIRKTPIVVNDARFFYANRCIIPYINEGVRMVAEGVEPALIENAAKQLGFPLGPLQLVDETSIDLGVKIAKATKAALGDAYPESPADDVLAALADQGRLGRKAEGRLLRLRRQGQARAPLARPRRALAAAPRPAAAHRRPAAPRDDPDPRGGPRPRGGRAHRRPRGRRRRHPRLGLHALVGRPLLLARHPRVARGGRDGRPPRRRARPALRRPRPPARDGGERRELLRRLPPRRGRLSRGPAQVSLPKRSSRKRWNSAHERASARSR